MEEIQHAGVCQLDGELFDGIVGDGFAQVFGDSPKLSVIGPGVLTVQARTRRLKTSSSARDVPLPADLIRLLAAHHVAYPGGPAAPVFPPPFSYRQAQKVFGKGCETAELHDVRVHDLRHTFGVHCVLAGIPLTRIQKMLGLATPAMTLRYARHAVEAHFSDDAAKLGASLSGTVDREAEALRRAVIHRAETA